LRPPGRNRWRTALGRVGDHHRSVSATGPGDTPSRRRRSCAAHQAATNPRARTASDDACCAVPTAQRDRRGSAPRAELLRSGRAEQNFDLGIQRALERVLVSPQFLFRIEQEPAGAALDRSTASGDFELASTPLFFRWSSIPEDELLDAAARETCANPKSCGGR